jgi:hypothetical protein
MTEDNEHAKTLMAARDKLVTKRRELAVALAMPSTRGESEEILERFTNLQGAIAAIEDAIKHERQLAGPQEPLVVAPHVESKPRNVPG